MRLYKYYSVGLSDEEMQLNYRNFIKLKPKAIRGYPSTLYAFARFIEKNKLKTIPIKMVLTAGEVLIPHYRSKIQEVFQAPVFDNYGAGDGGIASHECYMHEGLHIAEEKCIIEITDEKGNKLEDGKHGFVITTDLNNYVFPFIRYQVGDIAVIKPDFCSCGRKSKLFSSVLGRNGKLLFNKKGNPISPTLLPILLYPNMDYISYKNQVLYNKIDRYQIIQDEKGDLKVLLKMKNKIDEKYEDYTYIIDNYKKVFAGSNVDLIFVDNINKLNSGKEDYIISHYKYGD
jgi:phenylacetate-CoA ligase